MNPSENKEYSQSLRTQLSLASLMFFSPFVQLLMKKYTFEISEQDVDFVKGYMRLGWVCIFLLIISLASEIINIQIPLEIWNILYLSAMSVLILVLVVGCVGIFTDTRIIKASANQSEFSIKGIEISKMDILLDYLPIYNIYNRYKLHNFDKPNYIIKESILVWLIFTVFCMIGNNTLLSFGLVLIITRMVSLVSGIDMLPTNISKVIDQIFYKNPEEIRGYIVGTLIYGFKRITSKPESYSDCILKYKEPYTYLYDIKKFGIIQWQYLIAVVGIALAVWRWNLIPTTSFGYIAWIILVGRYAVMLLVWNHLPALPIIREVVTTVSSIGKK